ncbi:MAG TPA: glycosyltransferase family 39 protein [Anaerolineaceae bacterium]|nr:glycosyltransferase family 39 protein [Anaerolineaceae bacterium]
MTGTARTEPAAPDRLLQRRAIPWQALLPYLPAALLSLGGAALLIYDLRFGPWVFSDSTAYIASARSLAAGRGLGMVGPAGEFMPLTLHPPLYPALMALAIALFDLDPMTTAAALAVLAYAGSILLLTGGVYALTRSWVWGACAGGLMLASRAMVANFDGAMTEGLFIFLLLAVLFALAAFHRTAKTAWWVGAAVAAAAACLTRFTGIALVAAGALALLALGGGAWRQKAGRALRYALISALPLALWLGAGALQQGRLAARQVEARPDLLAAANQFRGALVEQLVLWLPFQSRLPDWRSKSLVFYGLALCVLGLGALALYRLRQNGRDQGGSSLWLLAGLVAAAYVGFVGFSYLFSSLPPDLNERMFSPLQPLVFLLAFGSPVLFERAYGLRPVSLRVAVQIVLLGLGLLAAWAYLPATLDWVEERHQTGSGYTSLEWRNSELAAAVRALPADVPLISNQAAAVLYTTGRFPYELTLPGPDGAVTPLAQGAWADVYVRQCAALVLFEQHPVVPPAQAETLIAGQQVYRDLQDGGIYFAPACPLPD